MLDFAVLSDRDLAWLNAFHAKCRQLVAPHVQGDALQWLLCNTEVIRRPQQ